MPQRDYYRRDLAYVHDAGFGFHADACAPGILALLRDVRKRDGIVLELGCGSGLLTRHLVDAGHRVIATDGSVAMVELARQKVPEADVRRLVLPDDPLPDADAIVSVGHVLSYLDDEAELGRALVAVAGALRPGGVLALDLCDLRWGELRSDQPPQIRKGEGWVILHEFWVPEPTHFARDITTFVRNDDGTWRRDFEHHDNVLIDTSRVPALLAAHSVRAEARRAFGDEQLPEGLTAIVGVRA